MNELAKTSASQDRAAVKGFVTSYAKCWDYYQDYMLDPNNTYKGFKAACEQEAKAQGIEIQLPADKTFLNRTTKLVKAGDIPERTQSDNPKAVQKRKERERAAATNSQIGKMSQPTQPAPVPEGTTVSNTPPYLENNDYCESTRIPSLECEVVGDDDYYTNGDDDYKRVLELLESVKDITGRYLTKNSQWSDLQWHSISCLAEQLQIRCDTKSADFLKRTAEDKERFDRKLAESTRLLREGGNGGLV